MGIRARIGKLLSFTRVVRDGGNVSDVKVDPGGGANITGEHFADPGDDSHPLPQDYPISVPLEREGVFPVVGYTDPSNTPKALPGEKRIYGRDENGTVIGEVWIKNDGTVLASNDAGSIEISPTGQIKSENSKGSVTIKEDGDIESVNAGGSIKLTPAGVMTTEAATSINLTSPLIVLTGGIQLNGSVSGGGGGQIESTVDFHTTKTVTADTQVTAAGKNLTPHNHPITGGSSAPGPTGNNN